jgi:hypothetical protein
MSSAASPRPPRFPAGLRGIRPLWARAVPADRPYGTSPTKSSPPDRPMASTCNMPGLVSGLVTARRGLGSGKQRGPDDPRRRVVRLVGHHLLRPDARRPGACRRALARRPAVSADRPRRAGRRGAPQGRIGGARQARPRTPDAGPTISLRSAGSARAYPAGNDAGRSGRAPPHRRGARALQLGSLFAIISLRPRIKCQLIRQKTMIFLHNTVYIFRKASFLRGVFLGNILRPARRLMCEPASIERV